MTRQVRHVLIGAVVGVVSLLVTLGALEAVLRWKPTILGYAYANGALSKYTTRAGGIYYSDRNVRVHFMIPNHTATMFANGYTWHHQTDGLGFRNPEPRVPADVVILGDSLVYGHGVEVEDTVARALERRSHLRVANLGRQGDCAFHEAYILTEYIGVFQPRWVVHVFAPNDVVDLYGFLSRKAMEDFIATPVSEIAYPSRVPPAAAMAERDARIRRRSIWKRVEEESYVAKMFRWMQYSYRPQPPTAWIRSAEAARTPDDVADVGGDPRSLGWRYTEHALAYMKYLSEKNGARLLMAPIGNDRQVAILREIARRHGIEFVDPSGLRSTPTPSFLPGDGHFSPDGARRMAELIAARIERR